MGYLLEYTFHKYSLAITKCHVVILNAERLKVHHP